MKTYPSMNLHQVDAIEIIESKALITEPGETFHTRKIIIKGVNFEFTINCASDHPSLLSFEKA